MPAVTLFPSRPSTPDCGHRDGFPTGLHRKSAIPSQDKQRRFPACMRKRSAFCFFAGIFLRCGMGSCPGRQKSRDAFLSEMRMPHFFRQTGALIQFGVRSSKIWRLFLSLLTLGIRLSSQEPFCGGSVRAVSLHTPSWELSLLPPRAFEEMEPGFFHLFKKIFSKELDRLLQSVFIIDSRKQLFPWDRSIKSSKIQGKRSVLQTEQPNEGGRW